MSLIRMGWIGTALIIYCFHAEAIPHLENTLEFSQDAIGPASDTDVRVWRDERDPSKFWWVGFDLQIKGTPSSGVPMFNWYSSEGSSRLSGVMELKPKSEFAEYAVRKLIAKTTGLTIERVKLLPVGLSNMQLTTQLPLRNGKTQILEPEEWLGRPGPSASDIPVSFRLSDALNSRLMDFPGDRSLPLLFLLRGEFFAKLYPGYSERTYGSNCVMREFLALDYASEFPADLAGFEFNEVRLIALAAMFESKCVSATRTFGTVPSLEQNLRTWKSHLIEKGLLSVSDKILKVGSGAALENFISVNSHTIRTEVAEPRSLYPVIITQLPIEVRGPHHEN